MRLAALAGVAVAMIGFFALIGTRMNKGDMALLYADLDTRDSSAIVAKLDAMNVPYTVSPDSSRIMVPSSRVGRLRLSMAEGGLPRGGGSGYELFDRQEAFGTTSFVQNLNQVRALEGELSRTIREIAGVQSARVHLVMPQRELFSRDRQEPSASIILRMAGAQRLARPQVQAVQHLVASAVPRLNPNRISIVDDRGTLLIRSGDVTGDGVLALSHTDEMRRSYETRLASAVQELLERSIGPGKVRAEVTVDMDFDRITTSSESYDPESQVVRSTQTVEETNSSQDSTADRAVSVGTNLPGGQTGGQNAGSAARGSRTEETVNYEISKIIKSHVREAGVVRRLSVAVLVDGNYATAPDGKRTYTPRSQEEMDKLTTLVRSAIGYKQDRGDAVELVNMQFTNTEAAEATDTGMLGLVNADYIKLAEILALGVVGALLVLLVLRPLATRVLEVSPLPRNARNPNESGAQQSLANEGRPAQIAGPEDAAAAAIQAESSSATDSSIDAMIDLAKVEGRVKASSIRKISEIVEKHPEEAVTIIRGWMYQES
jgi:flagellar M-ring protein FliF